MKNKLISLSLSPDHKSWWGSDRIDYVLQAPSTLEGVVSLPNTSYGHIVQSRYLEAKELASFVLRQVPTLYMYMYMEIFTRINLHEFRNL